MNEVVALRGTEKGDNDITLYSDKKVNGARVSKRRARIKNNLQNNVK